MTTSHVLAVLYLASTLTAAFTGWVAWRRRAQSPAAVSLTIVMGALVWWAGIESAAALLDLRGDHQFSPLAIYPGTAIVTAGLYCLCRGLADHTWRPGPRTHVLLLIEPVVVTAVVGTNRWHHLFVSSAAEVFPSGAPPGAGPPSAGPLFWAHIIYSYLLLAIAVGFVVHGWLVASTLYRRQLGLVLLGGAFPLAANVITLTRVAEGRPLDLTPVAFLLTGLVNGWALFRHDLMRLVPLARGLVLEGIDDAIVVIAPDGRVLDLNAAADVLLHGLTAGLPDRLPGLAMTRILGERWPGDGPRPGEYQIKVRDRPRTIDMRVNGLADHRGRAVGEVIVIRDVTQTQQQRDRLAEANDLLSQQLEVNDRLRQELAEQAIRDSLTGLHNRRYLLDVLAQELARAGRDGRPVSVIMLDIDRFKSVNDGYGHAMGDRLLIATAQGLADAVRDGDTVARYGGEEFLVVLPDTTTDQALARADEVRRRCAAIRIDGDDGPVSRTISAGVATFPFDGTAPPSLLAAADRALYAAKAAGRDRSLAASVVAPDLLNDPPPGPHPPHRSPCDQPGHPGEGRPGAPE